MFCPKVFKPSVLAPLSYGDAVPEVREGSERLADVLLVLCSALLLTQGVPTDTGTSGTESQ